MKKSFCRFAVVALLLVCGLPLAAQQKVVVLDSQVQTGVMTQGAINLLRDRMSTVISSSPDFYAVDSLEVNQTLESSEYLSANIHNLEVALSIGALLQADFVCYSTIQSFADSFYITANMANVSTRQVVRQADMLVDSLTPRFIFTAATELAAALIPDPATQAEESGQFSVNQTHIPGPGPVEQGTEPLSISLVVIPAGSFEMGSLNARDEGPPQMVMVDTFLMGAYEVTWYEWEYVRQWALQNGYAFTGRGQPGTGEGNAPDLPVTMISWEDAVTWCNARSEMEGFVPVYRYANSIVRDSTEPSVFSGMTVLWEENGYRLPTEAEWEYAAKRGAPDQSTEEQGALSDYAWFLDNSENRAHKVGTLNPNNAGLFDMRGNVWEWCWNWYDAQAYRQQQGENPTGPEGGVYRVLRGGSWFSPAESCRVSRRNYSLPDFRDNFIGLRVVQRGR